MHAFPHVPQFIGSLFVSEQPDAQHAWPPVHVSSQAPQVLVLVRLTQPPPQQISVGEHEVPQDPHACSGVRHAPPQHSWPAAHALPQAPQLAASSSVSTHDPPQHVSPLSQAGVQDRHSPSGRQPIGFGAPIAGQHTSSPVQATPQPLQCRRLEDVSTQRPSQHSCEPEHVLPQAPQLASSVCRSAQPPPQQASPGSQRSEQLPQKRAELVRFAHS